MVRSVLIIVVCLAGCEVPYRICASQLDCFGGEQCVDGTCVRAVVTDPSDAGSDADADVLRDCRLDESVCGARVCNVSTGRCEACQRDLQCGEGGLCDMIAGECTCAPGYHACGGRCVRDDSPDSCGDRCTPCPGDDRADPVCVAGACALQCHEGYRACADCGLEYACIQCEENTECRDYDAARCGQTALCEPCRTSEDCTHLDRKVCVDGVCEQCDIGESGACGNFSCDPATKRCTTTSLNSQQWCEPCLADSECEPNHRCVPMYFAGSLRMQAYCLVEADGSCLLPDPIQVQRDSLSGVRGDYYCAIREDLTTCEAVRDFARPCVEDDDCGVDGLADGKCRLFDGMRQCTYACSDDDECSGGTICIGNPPDNSYCARL